MAPRCPIFDRHTFWADPDQLSVQPGERIFDWRAKRFFDVVAALFLLLALMPLMAVLALAIKLDSRGFVFYRARRVDFGGCEFAMLKFRKMYDTASGPALTCAGDERFTRFGSFLARTKLDELPQLWNVLRGTMSLVGPRPEDLSFVAIYPDDFEDVLRAKPGITGLSQLAFAREGRLFDVPDSLGRYVEQLLPQKIAIDRLYVANRSLAMDLRILIWTVAAVLFDTEVAVDRQTGELSVRRRLPENPLAAVAEEART